MVISYTAAKKKQPKHKPQSVLVKDFMTKKLVSFHPDHSMHHAIVSLLKHGISGAPVVDDDGKLVGVISEGDCLKQVMRGKYTNSPELMGTVGDYMTPDPVTIGSEDNIMEIAKLFLKLRLRRFPVLENRKLVGQISQRDILAAVDELRNNTW